VRVTILGSRPAGWHQVGTTHATPTMLPVAMGGCCTGVWREGTGLIYIHKTTNSEIDLSISLGVPPRSPQVSTDFHKNDSTILWNYLRRSERVYTPENQLSTGSTGKTQGPRMRNYSLGGSELLAEPPSSSRRECLYGFPVEPVELWRVGHHRRSRPVFGQKVGSFGSVEACGDLWEKVRAVPRPIPCVRPAHAVSTGTRTRCSTPRTGPGPSSASLRR